MGLPVPGPRRCTGPGQKHHRPDPRCPALRNVDQASSTWAQHRRLVLRAGHAITAMTGLHAWFSAGALTGAIGGARPSPPVSYRGVYPPSPSSWRPGSRPPCSRPFPRRPPGRRLSRAPDAAPGRAQGLAASRGAVRHRADQRDVLRRRRAGKLLSTYLRITLAGACWSRVRRRLLSLRLAARAARRRRGATPSRGAPRGHGRRAARRPGCSRPSLPRPRPGDQQAAPRRVRHRPGRPYHAVLAGHSAPGRSTSRRHGYRRRLWRLHRQPAAHHRPWLPRPRACRLASPC